MNTDSILIPLLNSPKLPIYLAQIQSYLQQEAINRQEFYNLITENDKAEFIHGQVILHSPVRIEHYVSTELLMRLLSIYVDKHQLGMVGMEKLMVHLTRNSYEPDVCFWDYEKSNQFIEGQMLFPAPDFAVEVLSKSTEKTDRGVKMADYAAHGVSEYWLIHPTKRFIEKYVLREENYRLERIYTIEDTIKSLAVKGFHVSVIAIFDRIENMKELQRILKGEEITESEGW